MTSTCGPMPLRSSQGPNDPCSNSQPTRDHASGLSQSNTEFEADNFYPVFRLKFLETISEDRDFVLDIIALQDILSRLRVYLCNGVVNPPIL
jgi:hypothetical protein